jgi:DNA-binding XRE family transcriptional regulator
MTVQTITTPSGETLVVLPEADFLRMRDAAEMAYDIAAYDEAKRQLSSGEDEIMPADIAERLLAGENPVRVWRDHRGLSAKALCQAVGIAQGYLSQIETGKREGSIETLRKIAAELSVSLDDLA